MRPVGAMTATPASAQLVRLGDVVRLRKNRCEPATLENAPFLGMDDVEAHTGRILGPKTVMGLKSKVTLFEAGDVLYGRLRPYLNKVAAPEFAGAASPEFLVLQPSPRILARYLYRLLLAPHFVRHAEVRSKGDRPRVPFSAVSDYRFLLPPVDTQAAICEEVELFQVVADGLAATVEGLAGLADQLRGRTRDTHLHFSAGGASHPIGYLGDVVERIQYGTSKKCRYQPVATPVLRIPNVVSGKISRDDLKYAELGDAEVAALSLNKDDILVVRSNGSIDLVGRAAIVPEELTGYLFAGYLIRLTPSAKIDPRFLLHVLQSQHIRGQIERSARSTSGVNNINAKQLSRLEIPVPPLKEQSRLATLQSAIEDSCDSLLRSAGAFRELLSQCVNVFVMTLMGDAAKQIPQEAVKAIGGETDRSPATVTSIPSNSELVATMDTRRVSDPLRFIQDHLHLFSTDGLSFEELHMQIRADYEDLRDAIFELMGGENPLLRQQYDERRGVVVIQRRSK